MAAIRKFTNERIEKMRKRCHRSLFYFQRFVCGLKDMDDSHLELSLHIQARHRRSLIAAHRGFFKTSLGLSGVLWDALEIVDYTQMVLSQREELSKEMLERVRFMVQTQPLIQHIYADRFPANFDGWNTERMIFNRKEAHAGPSIVIGSLRGRQESRHVNHLYCDDLEGADANISDVPNEESEFFVRSRAEPLLIKPPTDRITVVGTPHGPHPLVHKLHDDPVWAVSWTPLTNENGEPAFPTRFPIGWCDEKREAARFSRQARQLYEEQLMLRAWVDTAGGFDVDHIRAFSYERLSGGYIRYPEIEIELWKIDPETNRPTISKRYNTIHISEMRFYLHFDPKHRDPDEMKGKTRPTTAAFIVVGITPDFHAFVMDTWIRDTGNLGNQLLACRQLYEKWVPYRVTWEAIGAQKWFKDQVRAYEKQGHRYHSRCSFDPRKGRGIPRMSTRMEESKKAIANKERQIVEALDTWFSMGWLHLDERHQELWSHLESFPSEERPIDGIDALAQGPALWKPPRSADENKIMQRRAHLMEAMNPEMPHTGYRPLGDTTIPVLPSVN